jgi:hypothetical protein
MLLVKFTYCITQPVGRVGMWVELGQTFLDFGGWVEEVIGLGWVTEF